MRILRSEIVIPQPREKVFPFFADATNLEKLVPDFLKFKILTPTPIAMKSGALIDYRIKLRGIPIKWRTEITLWDPPFMFIDAQLKGPYTAWVHVHTFEERGNETIAGDCVHYSVPGGALIDYLFVRRDVEKIFEFRREKMRELFG